MRYFFDIFDDDHWTRDDIGVDCRNDRHARNQGVLALTEMARDQLPLNGDGMVLRVRVRVLDTTCFTLALDFSTELGPALRALPT